MKRDSRRIKGIFLLPLLAVAAYGIVFIFAVPPWQNPDEPTHFEYAQLLSGKADTTPLQAEIIVSMDRHNYWELVKVETPLVLPESFSLAPFLQGAPSQIRKNPPLYYFIAGLFLRPVTTLSLESRLYCLRFFSLLLTLATVVVIGLAIRELPGNPSVSLAFLAPAVLIPQFIMIGASVSVEPAVNLVGAVIFLLCMRMWFRGFSVSRAALIFSACLVGLVISYKLTALLLPAVICCIFSPGSISKHRHPARGLILLILLAAGYLLLTWFFPEAIAKLMTRLSMGLSGILGIVERGSEISRGYWAWFNTRVFESVWFRYGWMKYSLPGVYYNFLQVFCLVSLVGLATGCLRRPYFHRVRELFPSIIFAVSSLLALYLYWGATGGESSAQGRHLFLAAGPWGILFGTGYLGFFPRRSQGGAAIGLTVLFILLVGCCLFGYLIPEFRS